MNGRLTKTLCRTYTAAGKARIDGGSFNVERVAKTDRILTANFLWVCFASFGAFGSFYLLLANLPVYIRDIGGSESEVGVVL